MKHLAIFDRKTVKEILLGKKTFELRVSKYRIPPFGRVRTGDLVLVKISGGKLIGQFRIGEVISLEFPQKKRVVWLRRVFQKKLCLPKDFWRDKKDACYFTLMEIASFSKFLTPPTKIVKHDRRGWVVLDKKGGSGKN